MRRRRQRRNKKRRRQRNRYFLFYSDFILFVLRCVLASLQDGLSVHPSLFIRSSVFPSISTGRLFSSLHLESPQDGLSVLPSQHPYRRFRPSILASLQDGLSVLPSQHLCKTVSPSVCRSILKIYLNLAFTTRYSQRHPSSAIASCYYAVMPS